MEIAKLINQGLTVAQAAAKVGCSRPTAYMQLYKAGFKLKLIAVRKNSKVT